MAEFDLSGIGKRALFGDVARPRALPRLVAPGEGDLTPGADPPAPILQTLEDIRRFEIEDLHDWFPPGTRVLEVGGGSGYQASVLASWGCAVDSVDLEDRPGAAGPRYFPVAAYDGRHLPFPDDSFDVVFSSNVLEHVDDLGALLAEMRRVLAPDGVGVHLMPTATWRLWTSALHYVYILRRMAGVTSRMDRGGGLSIATKAGQIGWSSVARRALVAQSHGQYHSAAAELYYFTRAHWRRVFEEAGFRIREARGSGLYYSGYGVWPRLTTTGRRGLARVLGSACHVFVTTRRA